MQHGRQLEDQIIHDRWLRIQQKDVFYALLHLQNQLGTTQESVLCFQSTLYGMSINDAVLLEIKNAVLKVTLAMDEMRLCFKTVGFNPGHANHRVRFPPRQPLFTPTPRHMAIPTVLHPVNFHFAQTPAQIRPRTPQPAAPNFTQVSSGVYGVPAAYNDGRISTPNYGNGSESVAYQCPPENVRSEEVLNSEAAVASESFNQLLEASAQPAKPHQDIGQTGMAHASDQSYEATLHPSSESCVDQDPLSFGEHEPGAYPEVPEYVIDQDAIPVSPSAAPHEVPEQAHDQTFASPTDEASHDVPDQLYDDETFDPLVHEASPIDYVLDQTLSPIPPQESSYEASEYLLDHTPILAPTCDETSHEAPENLLNQTSVAVPTCEVSEITAHTVNGAAALETTQSIQDHAESSVTAEVHNPELVLDDSVVFADAEESDPHCTEPETKPFPGSTPVSLSAMAAAKHITAILEGPVEASAPAPANSPNPDRAFANTRIAPGKLGGSIGKAAERTPRAPRRDSLEIPMLNSANGEVSFRGAKYRSGRDSSHSNGSIDGFDSPTLSESRTICNLKISPQPCEVDELAKSLEEHWSLNDPKASFSGGDRPNVCVPKGGILPTRIEEYRMPPPLKYVRTLVSYCADDSLFLQLMEDETPILKLDGPIEQAAKGAALKFSEVQPGDYVLCLFDLDKRFYRARLLRASGEDKFEVRFIDYGNTCITSVKNMRRLPDYLRRLGQCALKCELSEDLKPKAKEIIEELERVSLESHFLACFAETYTARDSKSPIFTLIDIQLIDGSSILRVPPPTSLKVSGTKFLVRNLVLGTLQTAKIDLVQDLERRKAISELLKDTPSLPCETIRVKVDSLVAHKSQRARVTKVGTGETVSLELIDEFQIEPENVPLRECSFLPLTAINIPPAASCIVCVAPGQDKDMLCELIQSKSDIEMTVVGEDVLPLVEFSKPVNATSG